MKKPKETLESEIKRFIIRCHKEIFGKGPEETWVKINHNLATYYCANILTELEEFFIKQDDEKDVAYLRKRAFALIKNRLVKELEQITEAEVLEVLQTVSINSKSVIGVIHFKINIE